MVAESDCMGTLSIMELSQFIADFEDAVEDLESGSVDAGTDFKSLEVWDSLAALTVIAMVDAEYNVRINSDVLKTTSTIEDLFNHIAGASA